MDESIRKNSFCVISINTYGKYTVHDIQTNSAWNENPYGKDYAVVPDKMVDDILKTKGFCNIELNADGTEVVSFAAREIPEIPKPEQPISDIEQLRADIDYLAIMTGVEL